MNPPVSDPSQATRPTRRKRSRGYAVAAAPRPTRKGVRFRCTNCGQKVLVDRSLRRAAITCPTCQELIPAPRHGRIWLEICGGAILFVAGLAIGYAPFSKPPLSASTAATVLPNGKSHQPHTKSNQPKPAWFTNNQDGTP
jgi:DNA-directed RNA polymerase subunit RPC12/RpoP